MVEWAMAAAASLLAPVGDRWLHVQGVVRRARKVIRGLDHDDAHWLIAAAYLHDVGWSPKLMDTGFHPIDGGRWLRGLGRERLETRPRTGHFDEEDCRA